MQKLVNFELMRQLANRRIFVIIELMRYYNQIDLNYKEKKSNSNGKNLPCILLAGLLGSKI